MFQIMFLSFLIIIKYLYFVKLQKIYMSKKTLQRPFYGFAVDEGFTSR